MMDFDWKTILLWTFVLSYVVAIVIAIWCHRYMVVWRRRYHAHYDIRNRSLKEVIEFMQIALLYSNLSREQRLEASLSVSLNAMETEKCRDIYFERKSDGAMIKVTRVDGLPEDMSSDHQEVS